MQKALYGCLSSTLILYEKMVPYLKSRRFIINPYDPCVAYIMANGNHITITWPFNDLKTLHVDADEVTKVIDWMKGIYDSHMK